ncbi:MAG: DUF3313 domain-containing protein [bacterium]|nr:DUF3313 domain-containing protein [bacterium]
MLLRHSLVLALFATALLGVGGCAATHPAPVSTSGFLDDYDQLVPGAEDEVGLLYIDPEADFTRCGKIVVDIVTIRRTVAGPTDIPEAVLTT